MTWKTIFGSLLIPLNAILLFFLLFDSRLVVPAWLLVLGRLHRMALHFPIVLIIGYAWWEWVIAKRAGRIMPWPEQVAEGLMLARAFTATSTGMIGLWLSR